MAKKLTQVWQQFSEHDQQTIRAALKKPAKLRLPGELELVRMYWRLLRQRSRAGIEVDLRRNADFRNWLEEIGMAARGYTQELYNEWRRNRYPGGCGSHPDCGGDSPAADAGVVRESRGDQQ